MSRAVQNPAVLEGLAERWEKGDVPGPPYNPGCGAEFTRGRGPSRVPPGRELRPDPVFDKFLACNSNSPVFLQGKQGPGMREMKPKI